MATTDKIILTPPDIGAVNIGRLAEELETALGAAVRVGGGWRAGSLTEVTVRRGDDGLFIPDEVSIIYTVAAAHDAGLLSLEQSLDEAADFRRDSARDRLTLLGADGVRVAGLPGLSEIVADIVEALALDINQ